MSTVVFAEYFAEMADGYREAYVDMGLSEDEGNLLEEKPMETEFTFLEGHALADGDVVALKQEMVRRPSHLSVERARVVTLDVTHNGRYTP